MKGLNTALHGYVNLVQENNFTAMTVTMHGHTAISTMLCRSLCLNNKILSDLHPNNVGLSFSFQGVWCANSELQSYHMLCVARNSLLILCSSFIMQLYHFNNHCDFISHCGYKFRTETVETLELQYQSTIVTPALPLFNIGKMHKNPDELCPIETTLSRE